MFKQIFWIIFSACSVFLIWAVFSLSITDLQQAIAYQTHTTLTQVQQATQPILQATEQVYASKPSFGNLDEFVKNKDEIATLYFILLELRTHELSLALLVVSPAMVLLIYDLILMKRIRVYSLVYISSMHKSLYLHTLSLSLYAMVICFFIPYRMDMRFVYLAMIVCAFTAYKIRLMMASSKQFNTIT